MKVTVIGTGFGARVVAPAFAAADGCEVVDVVSPRDEQEVTRAIDRIDVDLVSVHSPPFLHADHVRAALTAGKAVLCDKPFAIDGDEAQALVDDATAWNAIALCNFEFRLHPVRRLLRDLVRTNKLGRIEHVQWTHLSAGSRVPMRRYGWLFDRTRGGGWVGAWASHAVDAIRWTFGEITSVDARLRIDVAERPDEHGRMYTCTAEDGMTATLGVQGGISVSIDSSFVASATVPPRLVVAGATAVCEVVADERVLLRHADGRREDLTPAARASRAGDRHDDPMRRFAEVVRDVVTSGEVPPGVPTFADGLACDRVLDQLRAAPVVTRSR